MKTSPTLGKGVLPSASSKVVSEEVMWGASLRATRRLWLVLLLAVGGGGLAGAFLMGCERMVRSGGTLERSGRAFQQRLSIPPPPGFADSFAGRSSSGWPDQMQLMKGHVG